MGTELSAMDCACTEALHGRFGNAYTGCEPFPVMPAHVASIHVCFLWLVR